MAETESNQGAEGTRLGVAGLLLQPLYLFVCVCRQISVCDDRIAGSIVNRTADPCARAGAALWGGPGLWGGLGHGCCAACWGCSNTSG